MKQASCYDVIGVGVSTLDLLMVVDELPGGEGVQRAHESMLSGGGPVATAMVTLARLGARVAMADKLGDDWRGRAILDEFEREGVATGLVAVVSNRSSSIASILVRKDDGARAISYAPGDVAELAPADLPEGVLESCGIIHMNGRHLDASLHLARKAKEQGTLVSFDGGAHRYRAELKELIKLSDICILAREFAGSMSGGADVEAAAADLLGGGPGVVVITAGTEGAWVFTKESDSFHVPAFKIDAVVDTTGAGDAFHGAFLYGIVRNYDLPGCALLASAVAAMNTRQLGGRAALPSFEEARAFLRERGFSLDDGKASAAVAVKNLHT